MINHRSNKIMKKRIDQWANEKSTLEQKALYNIEHNQLPYKSY